jgi:alpha/beta superfamily hydrolase
MGGMLKERPVEFQGPGGRIEARLADASASNRGALLVLHPHPLYGGSMDNNVVETIVRAGQACGLSTLRFNFRGVGRSQGVYAEGLGEQDDIGGALRFLEQDVGAETKILAGYSFGACVGLGYCHRPNHGIDHLFLISPPPLLLSKDVSMELSVVRKIVLGEMDELAPMAEVQSQVSTDKREELIHMVPRADHFFSGQEEELEKLLQSFLEKE